MAFGKHRGGGNQIVPCKAVLAFYNFVSSTCWYVANRHHEIVDMKLRSRFICASAARLKVILLSIVNMMQAIGCLAQ